MPARPSEKKLRVPDEVAELVRRSHPQLKATVKAALKDILEDPACGKALIFNQRTTTIDSSLL